MNYQECIAYLENVCPRGSSGGKERTAIMAELIGNPQDSLNIIHVAGTNGKGSTSAVIESILRHAGYRVGLFTSPHLERYEERIQINRQPIPEAEFTAIMSDLIETVIPKAMADGMSHPGAFGLLTLAAFRYFSGKTDFVVLEVGLGGWLDPTNIIKAPVLSVITPLSLEHCQILGDTIEQIAKEKAGIIKPGIPAVTAPQDERALEVLKADAAEKQSPLTCLYKDTSKPVATSLVGSYQQMNCNTALAAIENLKARNMIHVTPEQIAQALLNVSWPGRMEYFALDEGKAILLDGAHNPAGIAGLAENLRELYHDREIILFLSILDDKEQITMLREILPLASAVVLTRPEHDERAQHWMQLEQYIQELAPGCPCRMYDNDRTGLKEEVARLEAGQLLCVTGSLYLISDCRAYLVHELL
ncbi:MAG: bifunctional folylpolyglutamate synthase/dihydrofolate synthase [Peptococcaceae bacterium]|nr:bifunctional folylpolyglutamate synthase/dihydrofolate synthase [Peptococcaceae bacterium]